MIDKITKKLTLQREKIKVKGNTIPRYRIVVEKERIESVLKEFKKAGYEHFSCLTCVDWLEKGKFELIYHLLSYIYREDVFLSVFIDRDNPKIKSLRHIFPQIETYEREIHEMFGVEFVGNPRLGEFILEDWDSIPPMRKDFDTEKYVQEKFLKVPPVEGDEV